MVVVKLLWNYSIQNPSLSELREIKNNLLQESIIATSNTIIHRTSPLFSAPQLLSPTHIHTHAYTLLWCWQLSAWCLPAQRSYLGPVSSGRRLCDGQNFWWLSELLVAVLVINILPTWATSLRLSSSQRRNIYVDMCQPLWNQCKLLLAPTTENKHIRTYIYTNTSSLLTLAPCPEARAPLPPIIHRPSLPVLSGPPTDPEHTNFELILLTLLHNFQGVWKLSGALVVWKSGPE